MPWYELPLLAIVFLLYAGEVQAARRRSGQWNAVVAGAPVFAADFVNETTNGWPFANRGRLLIWDCEWWNNGPLSIVPIFVFGYLWFFAAA